MNTVSNISIQMPMCLSFHQTANEKSSILIKKTEVMMIKAKKKEGKKSRLDDR
jgi:hypothetical protein